MPRSAVLVTFFTLFSGLSSLKLGVKDADEGFRVLMSAAVYLEGRALWLLLTLATTKVSLLWTTLLGGPRGVEDWLGACLRRRGARKGLSPPDSGVLGALSSGSCRVR